MIGRRIVYLGILAGCLVFYFCHQQWISWILLLCTLVLPLLVLALSLPAMLQFRGELEAPDHAPLGGIVHVSLWGLSHLPQPRFLGRVICTDLITGESARHNPKHPLPADHCGGLRLDVTGLRVCDYLGLFAIPVKKTEPRVVVIRPAPLALAELPDLSRCIPRAWVPKHGGGFAENHELRLYRPGDNLNQVHWKLSAKTGKLILREPMEPVLDRLVLTLDLTGTREELDRNFGRLLWLCRQLLEQNLPHEIRCLTGEGVIVHFIDHEDSLIKAVDDLLCRPAAPGGTLRDRVNGGVWQFHVGGDGHEV